MALIGLAADPEAAEVLGLVGTSLPAQLARSQPVGQHSPDASPLSLNSGAEALKADREGLEPADKLRPVALGARAPGSSGSSEARASLPEGMEEPADSRLRPVSSGAGVSEAADSPESRIAEQSDLQPATASPSPVQAIGALAEWERPRPLSCLPSAKYRVVEGPSRLALARALAAPRGTARLARAQPPPPPLCLRHRLKPLSAPLLGAMEPAWLLCHLNSTRAAAMCQL